MSFCRWSTPITELTPNVDVSIEKMIKLYKEGGEEAWHQYKKDNKVILSDAYVYEHVGGFFICHWAKSEDYTTDTAKEMAEYLQHEKDKGALVPQFAIDGLLESETGELEGFD